MHKLLNGEGSGAGEPDASLDSDGISLNGALRAWSHGVSERERAHRPETLSPPVLLGRSLQLLEIGRWSPTVQRVLPLPRA
jgi:hypothetical protein